MNHQQVEALVKSTIPNSVHVMITDAPFQGRKAVYLDVSLADQYGRHSPCSKNYSACCMFDYEKPTMEWDEELVDILLRDIVEEIRQGLHVSMTEESPAVARELKI